MRRFIPQPLALLKYTFISLLAFLLLIVAALYFALSSTKVSQILFEKVSGLVSELTLDYEQGNLRNGLQFGVEYKNDAVSVTAASIFVRANLGCLWRTTLCIEKITVDELIITYYTSDVEKEKQPISLPEIISPITIEIDKFTIKQLFVNQGNATANNEQSAPQNTSVYRAENIEAELGMMGSKVSIDALKLVDDYCQWLALGDIRLRQQYPLEVHIECADNDYVSHIAADIDGDLSELTFAALAQINATALPVSFASENIEAELTGRIDVLAAELPFELLVHSTQPLDLKLAEEIIHIRSFEGKLHGPVLQPTIELNTALENAGLPGLHQINATAQLLPGQLEIVDAQYQWNEGVLKAKGLLDYQEAIGWQGTARWDNFSYSVGETQLSKIAGDMSFDGSYRKSESGNGGNSNNGDKNTLRNHIALQQLTATILENTLSAQGDFEIVDSDVTVHRFHLEESAQNFVDVSGSIRNNTLALTTNIQLQDFKRVIADLTGSAEASFKIQGALSRPKIVGQVDLKTVVYQNLSIAEGDLLVDWDSVADRKNKLSLHLQEFVLPNGKKTDINIAWNGTIKDHALVATWQGLEDQEDKSLDVRCKGSIPQTTSQLTFSRWVGVCDTVDLAYQWQVAQLWQLDKPIEIDWQIADKALSVSTFCLQNAIQGAVCSNEFIHWRDGNIADVNVQGEKLPLVWLEVFTPKNLSVHGSWEFALSGSDLLTNPDLTMNIAGVQASAEWHMGNSDAIRMVFTQLLASWHWQGDDHRIAWDAQTVQSGLIEGHVNLDKKAIEGEWVISDLLLDRFAPLVMPAASDTLLGRVNMGVSVSGTIEKPIFNGQLSVADGFIEAKQLPSAIEKISIDINVVNNVASLQGVFESQKKPGTLGGNIRWSVEQWDGDLTFAAKDLVFRPEPTIELHVSPQLALHVADNKIKLTGDIALPKARIEIKELPEQAITVSSDAVIIGDKRDAQGRGIESEIRITLGDDVWFKGFGLESEIEGSLLLIAKPVEPLRATGTLRLVNGRYKAYGQNLLIREGDLVFVNNIENPQIRVEAVRDRTDDNVTVGLRAVGTASEPRISIFSDPDMARQEQLSYLLTGSAPGQGDDLNPSEAAAEAALGYALESELGGSLTRQAGQLLGVNDLRVTTISGDTGTQVGLSGYLTPNLMVSYGIGVFDAVNYLTLNYRLTKNIYLEMVSGETSAFDILWNFDVD